MSNEENVTGIATEETSGTDSSKHILKRLENSVKLDKIPETFSLVLQA